METQTPESLQFLQSIQLDNIPLALLILLGAVLLQQFNTRFLDDLGNKFTDRRLLFKKVGAFSRFSIYLVSVIMLFNLLLDLSSEALLGIMATIGLALGFAFKDLLASLMAGVILLIDAPFQVGDRIAFGRYYGEVTAIGLRSVRIQTLDDNTVTIPNSAFLTETVASANAGALDCMVVIPFYIAAAENVARAKRIVAEATATSRYVYLEKPVVTLVSDEFLGERFVTVIRSKAYVFDARYEKAFLSDVTERVKIAFRKADIRTPDQQYRDLDLNTGCETAPTKKQEA